MVGGDDDDDGDEDNEDDVGWEIGAVGRRENRVIPVDFVLSAEAE